jgi:hypothetical protein
MLWICRKVVDLSKSCRKFVRKVVDLSKSCGFVVDLSKSCGFVVDLLWICCRFAVQLVVQQIHNKSNKWSLSLCSQNQTETYKSECVLVYCNQLSNLQSANASYYGPMHLLLLSYVSTRRPTRRFSSSPEGVAGLHFRSPLHSSLDGRRDDRVT